MKKTFRALILTFAAVLPLVLGTAAVSAAPVDPLSDVCKRAGANSASAPAACQDKNLGEGNPLYGPQGILTKIVDILTIVVGIAAVISMIYAGIRFVTSGDNPEQVGQAREYIQYAFIGLVLAAVAQALVRLVLFRIFENRVI